MSTRHIIITLLVVGIAMRVALLGIGFWKDGPRVFLNYSDAVGYATLAQNLLEGHGFSLEKEAPFLSTVFRVPGYPLFLLFSLLLVKSFLLAVALQIFLGALVPVLGYLLLEKLRFSRRIAWGVALALALEPFLAAHSIFLLTEVLFLATFFLAILYYLRYREEGKFVLLIAAALLLGVGALIRPIGFYLVFIMAAHLLVTSVMRERGRIWHHMGAALLLFLMGMAVLAPWLARNWYYFGVPKLSSIDNTNLYFYHAASVLAREHRTSIDTERRVLLDTLRKEGIDAKSLRAGKALRKKSFEIFAAHPQSFVEVTALTAWQFFTHDAYYDLAVHLGFYRNRGMPPLTILKLQESLRKLPTLFFDEPSFFLFVGGRIVWMLLFVGFCAGIIRSLRMPSHRARDCFLLILIGYFLFTSLSTGYGVNARLRMPIVPFYLVYAFLGWQSLIGSLGKKRYGLHL